MSGEPIRINRFLAMAGVASRRTCDTWILAGRVMVDGRPVRTLGQTIIPGVNHVSVDGHAVVLPSGTVTVLLHKPAGVTATLRDPHAARTVCDLLPTEFRQLRLFPIGRLDRETTGLILLTNDGELAHALTHPRHHVPKTYRVVVAGHPRGDFWRGLAQGVALADGKTSPAQVGKSRRLGANVGFWLTIHEGRKRMIRRMCAALGHPVVALHRTQVGPLELGRLPEGGCRKLTLREVGELRQSADLS